MATFPNPAAAAITFGSPRQLLEIPEKFTLTVLAGCEKHSVFGRVIKLVERRLIAQVSADLQADTCIRIDCDDSFVLGETLGCRQEGNEMFAAIDLQQAVTGLRQLAAYMDQPQTTTRKFEVRRRA